MIRIKSNIDFSNFVNTKIKMILIDNNRPLTVCFSNGRLIVECSWRISSKEGILYGSSDVVELGLKKLKKLLEKKTVANIYHYMHVSDLFIEFSDQTYLELFHNSSYYEGWELLGENGFHLVSLPGGSHSEF